MTNPFHAWLIRKRRYCEHRGCLDRLTPATKVYNLNGKDYVYCAAHYERMIHNALGPIEQGLRERGTLEAKPIANKE